MDCVTFKEKLADFLEGNLTREAHEAAKRHLSFCTDCRREFDIVRGHINLLPEEEQASLTHAILARTSGHACERAQQILCNYMDNKLGDEESHLVALHLEHCSNCKTIAGTLAELGEILPGMAELDPGSYFTDAVLQETSMLARPRAGRLKGLKEWWTGLVQRPRFAWEAAYVGTLIFVLLFGTPVMALRDFQSNRNSGFQSRMREAVTSISRIVPETWHDAGEKAGRIKDDMAGRISERQKAIRNLVSDMHENSDKGWSARIKTYFRSAGDWFRKMLGGLQGLWDYLTGSDNSDTENG